jgi:hypothetical protein
MIPPLTVVGTVAISASAAAAGRQVGRRRFALRPLDEHEASPETLFEVALAERHVAPLALGEPKHVEHGIDPDRLRLLVSRRL